MSERTFQLGAQASAPGARRGPMRGDPLAPAGAKSAEAKPFQTRARGGRGLETIALRSAAKSVPPSGAAPVRRAFTIIELMVVIGIIAVLVSVLLVAFNGARNMAARNSAERFVGTVGQAVEAFKNDLTYYPPLLAYEESADAQPMMGNPSTTSTSVIVPEAFASGANVPQFLAKIRFASEFTLPVYLMGAGNLDNSQGSGEVVGGNTEKDDGHAGPGFRDPGPDRSWGGAADRAVQSPNGQPPGRAMTTGRVYGPYLDPAQMSDHLKLDALTGLFKLTDPWDQPVRYYARWPVTDNTPQRRTSIDFVPVELRSAAAVEAQLDDAAFMPNLEMERDVLNAPYAILSAGKPILFESEGVPIPLFGDRKRVDAATTLIDMTMGTHAPGTAFNPANFPSDLGVVGEPRRNLLDDLRSNVRYIP